MSENTRAQFAVTMGDNHRAFRVTDATGQTVADVRDPALGTALCMLFQHGSELLPNRRDEYQRYMHWLQGRRFFPPYGGSNFIITFERHEGVCTVTVLFCQRHEREYRAARAWMTAAERHALDQRCLDLRLPEKVDRDLIIITGWPAELLCAGRWYVDGTRPH